MCSHFDSDVALPIVSLTRLHPLRSRLVSPLQVTTRLSPVESQYPAMFCFGLLTIASALASFAFACAMPFAAYAVIAAAVLPLRPMRARLV